MNEKMFEIKIFNDESYLIKFTTVLGRNVVIRKVRRLLVENATYELDENKNHNFTGWTGYTVDSEAPNGTLHRDWITKEMYEELFTCLKEIARKKTKEEMYVNRTTKIRF